MQTRSQKKRFIVPVLFVALVIAQQSAYGQFNKYRSQTRFNPDKKESVESSTPDVDTMSAEDAAAALKAVEKLEQDAEAADSGDSEESDNESAFKGDSDDDANEETFGSRPSPQQNATPAKSSKYVNLNPETAFGPEIVDSFDFPDTALPAALQN